MDFIALLKYTKRYSKRLYWIVLIVIVGSLFTCFVTLNTIWPFFAYSLYAFPEKDKIDYKSVEIVLNGKIFNFYNELPQAIAVCLESSANQYIYLKQNKYTDPFYYKLLDRGVQLPKFLDPVFKHKNISDSEFTKWMKNYIELHTDYKIKSLKVNEININFYPKAKITGSTNVLATTF
ncbi:MAG: hypothetical protein EOO47_25255 [Flavobacterium sp.]|nr:MAG: hypothetical protein EOO47_25255 [Flavobacterium sp.]